MVMTLKEIKLEEVNCCTLCGGEWTTITLRERYCNGCKTHLVMIEDEVYFTQGW